MNPNSNIIRGDQKSEGELDSDYEIISEGSQTYLENSNHDVQSSSSDTDVQMTYVKRAGRKSNDVWRNVIECDQLEQQMVNILSDKEKVSRGVESYALPPNRKRKYYPYHHRYKNTNRTYSRYSTKIDNNPEVWMLDDIGNGSNSHKTQPPNQCQVDLGTFDSTSDHNAESDYLDRGDVSSSSTLLKSNLKSESSSSSDSEPGGKQRKLKEGGKTIEGAWDRLAKRIHNENMMEEFNNGRKELSIKIAKILNEPKVNIIDQCLYYLGLEKCKTFLDAVKDIEDGDGMLTQDGSRRRTAGGVFFTLIRADTSIDSILMQLIFDEKVDNNSQEYRLFGSDPRFPIRLDSNDGEVLDPNERYWHSEREWLIRGQFSRPRKHYYPKRRRNQGIGKSR